MPSFFTKPRIFSDIALSAGALAAAVTTGDSRWLSVGLAALGDAITTHYASQNETLATLETISFIALIKATLSFDPLAVAFCTITAAFSQAENVRAIIRAR